MFALCEVRIRPNDSRPDDLVAALVVEDVDQDALARGVLNARPQKNLIHTADHPRSRPADQPPGAMCVGRPYPSRPADQWQGRSDDERRGEPLPPAGRLCGEAG
jgi:hypothetical protein